MIYDNSENPTLESIIISAISEALSNTHTTLIAKVTKVNKTTINCKPVISRVVNKEVVELPEFAEVPVINFLGGMSSIQMPIAVDDYCILFVSERCFDSWYSGEDFAEPLEPRMHDYSDSIALVGLKNKDGELEIPKVLTMLGDVFQKGNYEHEGDRKQKGNYDLEGDVTHKGNYNIEGDLTIDGNLTVSGNIKADGNANIGGNLECGGDATIGGISFLGHVHIGNQGAPTSPPQ